LVTSVGFDDSKPPDEMPPDEMPRVESA